jgi:hypothetical protein
LTPDQKKELDAAKRYLFSDVDNRVEHPRVARYWDLYFSVAQATDDLELFKKTNPGKNPPAKLVVTQLRAQTKFEQEGDAGNIEANSEKLRRYEHLDPDTWWRSLRTQYNSGIRKFGGQGGREFGIYTFYPKYQKWFDPNFSWTNITLTDKDLEKIEKSKKTSVGGGLGAGWGLFRASASYGKDTKWEYKQNEVTEFQISGEYSRVFISRPWLDGFVFKSTRWDWSTGTPVKGLISDGGDAANGITPKGLMPFLPVGLLLARNVSLSGKWEKNINEFYEEHVRGGGKIGWGPFSFGGRTNEEKKETYEKAQSAGNTITFTSPQIVGFFVKVLDRSPAPDFKPSAEMVARSESIRENVRILSQQSSELLSKSGVSIPRENLEQAILEAIASAEVPSDAAIIPGGPLVAKSADLLRRAEDVLNSFSLGN